MKTRKNEGVIAIVLMASLLLSGCFGASTAAPTAEETSTEATSAAGTTSAPPIPETARQLVLVFTSDEHGWMAGYKPGMGAAELADLVDKAGAENTPVLLFSDGDNWTGPAISTWFDGQSMLEVMNAMGYDAAAIGNHEFDFGLETLKTRIAEASFPFLSANMRYKDGDRLPGDLGILPYTIIEIIGLHVGVIGLSTTETPYVTNPDTVAPFEFTGYEEALREFVPEMRAAGATIIVAITHICPEELTTLARKVQDLEIVAMSAGHCHFKFETKAGGTLLVSPGARLENYAVVRLELDQDGIVTSAKSEVLTNRGGAADPQIADLIASWQAKTDEELSLPIGYLENAISKDSDEIGALIVESWLAGYPNADFAFTNTGGIRDGLPAGQVTLAHLVSVMPFDNYLMALTLTGAQIEQILDETRFLVLGGLKRSGGKWVVASTGEPLDPEASYIVLTNDFLYAGGDGMDMLARFDPDAYPTGIDWRQPVIDWISAQNSTQQNPLDAAIQALLR